MNEIRLVSKADIPALKEVLKSIDLFPVEMLEEMISDYLNNKDTEQIWFTATVDDRPISLGYCSPEELTEGTFNLIALGVRSDIQAKGIGGKMIEFIENHLKTKGARLLIIETSGSSDFELARRFYEKLDYRKEAVINDFWSDGDDKVIYSKKLS